MSVKQMALVWEHEFDHAEQSVMLALADHAHDDGTEIRPSVARLAWKTGYEARQVQRILKHLRDDLEILVLVTEGGGRGKPNVYRFDWVKGVKKSPFKPKRVTLSKEKGVTATSPEPSSLEPSYSRKGSKDLPNPLVNPMGYFSVLANIMEIKTEDSDRKHLPKQFKDLLRLKEPPREEMVQVITHILSERLKGYDVSPQKAWTWLHNRNVYPLHQETKKLPEKRWIS